MWNFKNDPKFRSLQKNAILQISTPNFQTIFVVSDSEFNHLLLKSSLVYVEKRYLKCGIYLVMLIFFE